MTIHKCTLITQGCQTYALAERAFFFIKWIIGLRYSYPYNFTTCLRLDQQFRNVIKINTKILRGPIKKLIVEKSFRDELSLGFVLFDRFAFFCTRRGGCKICEYLTGAAVGRVPLKLSV